MEPKNTPDEFDHDKLWEKGISAFCEYKFVWSMGAIDLDPEDFPIEFEEEAVDWLWDNRQDFEKESD